MATAVINRVDKLKRKIKSSLQIRFEFHTNGKNDAITVNVAIYVNR